MKKLIIILWMALTLPAVADYNYISNQRIAGPTTNGTSWANAWVSLTNIQNAVNNGDTNFVAFCHNEALNAAVTLSPKGTAAAPAIILCTDTNSEPPTTVTNTAVYKLAGANTMPFKGVPYVYIYGINFYCHGTSIQFVDNSSSWDYTFEDCTLALTNATSTSRITCGIMGSVRDMHLKFVNCRFGFGHVTQAFNVSQVKLDFVGCTNKPFLTVAPCVIPTNMFWGNSAGINPIVNVIGCDLSQFTNNLVAAGTANTAMGTYRFIDCRLTNNVTIATGSNSSQAGPEVRVINCDSADTNYRFYKWGFLGTESHETTIVRTGGATDGTTPFSRKLISTAFSSWWAPMESEWIYGWNGTTNSSLVLGVSIVNDGTTFNNNDIWLVTEYLGQSGFPQGMWQNSSNTNILAGVNAVPTCTRTWVTNGLSSAVKQCLATTITPQGKGWIRSKVCLAKPSTTVYYDPIFTNGYTRAYMTLDGVVNGGTANSPAVGMGASGLLSIFD